MSIRRSTRQPVASSRSAASSTRYTNAASASRPRSDAAISTRGRYRANAASRSPDTSTAPRGLRLCSEHLFPLRFRDLIPPPIITADPRSIRSFLGEHGVAVVKPVDGFSGRRVLRLHRHDPNLTSLIEIVTDGGTRPVIVQRFLREVGDGNKRIFV